MIVNWLNNCGHLIVNSAKFFISRRPVIESQRRPTLAPQLCFLQKKRKQINFLLVCENNLIWIYVKVSNQAISEVCMWKKTYISYPTYPNQHLGFVGENWWLIWHIHVHIFVLYYVARAKHILKDLELNQFIIIWLSNYAN